jgi:microcompartment protein CcmL/EutN
MKAIGLIEVSGFVTAIEALDSMTKSADISFLTWEKKLGGRLVTIIISGSVASVTCALEAGRESASKVGKVAASGVIANPHEEVMKMVKLSAQKLPKVKSGDINEF